MTASDDIDADLKRLELEIKREELKRVRSGRRLQWITPTAIGVIVPMIGGLGLWIFNEVKTFNEGYRALEEVAAVRAEKDALAAQKDSLNLEIAALILQKGDYQAEAQRMEDRALARQALIDRTYLRAKFAVSEASYALNHTLVGFAPPDQAAIAALEETVSDDQALSILVTDLVERVRFSESMSGVADEELSALLTDLDRIEPSAEALALNWLPVGAIGGDRSLMVADNDTNPRFYDVHLGRFLTPEEVAAISSNR